MSQQTTPYTTFQPDPYNTDLCSISTCSLHYAMLTYLPTLAGNSIYLVIFALFLIAHLYLGIRYKTWGFMVGTTCCFLLEIIGYAGRLIMHNNPFPLNNFLLYFIPLALGPAFMTGGIYVILGRYIIATNPKASYLAPRTITIIFITCDVFSLVLQSIGGALTSTATTDAGRTQGTDILTAGLSTQVASMFFFLLTWAIFAFRLRKVSTSEQNPIFADVRRTWLWRGFQPAVFGAMIFIFIRCIYRAVELNQGFGGALANDETTFMVLEGPMIMIAALLVTIFHPGFVFGGLWREAAWTWKGKDVMPETAEKVTSGTSSVA